MELSKVGGCECVWIELTFFKKKSVAVYKLVKLILKINGQNLSSAANKTGSKLAQTVHKSTAFPKCSSIAWNTNKYK